MTAFLALLLVLAFVCGLLYGVEKIVKAKVWKRRNRNQIVRSMARYRSHG
jgi:flagellar biogenesis protein FliO